MNDDFKKQLDGLKKRFKKESATLTRIKDKMKLSMSDVVTITEDMKGQIQKNLVTAKHLGLFLFG